METFKNKNWDGKRNHECTNVVACIAREAPDDNWIECEPEYLVDLKAKGARQLEIQGGVRYFGWL